MQPERSLPCSQEPATFHILSQSNPVHNQPYDFFKIHSKMIYQRTGHTSGLLLSGLPPPPNSVCTSPLPMHATCTTHLIILDFYHPDNVLWLVQNAKFFAVTFPTVPCHLAPFRPKHIPQHPILRHLWPALLPRFERPSFTPTSNNMQNYTSVYFNLYIFGK